MDTEQETPVVHQEWYSQIVLHTWYEPLQSGRSSGLKFGNGEAHGDEESDECPFQ
jgi:hypothetical protein